MALKIHSQSYSINSGIGGIMTPSARFANEGVIALNISEYAPLNKLNLIAYPFNWLEASVHYTDINVRRYYPGSKQSYKDKGFSFKIKIIDENAFFPTFSIGFEDIAGTSIFKSEYIVGTKKYGNFDISVGLGFGDFGSRGTIENFFRKGDRQKWDFSTGGEINTDFFKGKSSIFANAIYSIPKFRSRLKIEYDGNSYRDNYDLIPGFARYEPKSRYNFGVETKLSNNFSIGINFIKGNEIAVNFLSKINISSSKNDYNLKISNSSSYKSRYLKILQDLKESNIYLQNALIDDRGKIVIIKYVQNSYYNDELVAEQIATYLENTFDFYGYKLKIIPGNGAYMSSTLSRHYDSAIKYTKSLHIDYPFSPKINYPVYSFNISPKLLSHIGSPSGFYFGGIDLSLSNVIEYKKFQLTSDFGIRVYDNFSGLNYNSNPTTLPQVRTNIQEYLKQPKNRFNELTINYFSQANSEHNFLVVAGHLESMFSGTHFEYLFKPTNALFSLGFENSYVVQRKPDGKFDSFLNYRTNVRHINLYFSEPTNRLVFHLSYGKYLAKDKGATFNVSRRFKNGAAIGAFFSITNISSEEFGEGSFDKGVYFKFPINIFNKKENTKSFSSFIYRPITRDGAAKINLSKRLYDLTEGSQYYEGFLKRNY